MWDEVLITKPFSLVAGNKVIETLRRNDSKYTAAPCTKTVKHLIKTLEILEQCLTNLAPEM